MNIKEEINKLKIYKKYYDKEASGVTYELELIRKDEVIELLCRLEKLGYKEGAVQPGAVAEIGTLDEFLNNIRSEEFTIDNDFSEKETIKYKAGLFWVARRIIERIKEIDQNYKHESIDYEYFDRY